ncbi:ribosomal RNA adenine dimethylase family protein [Candidatus Nitrosopumilus salaria BD31]|jgi:16S rRNA (adenine1518-N6/adenine1519-N6)-dimethyltransferase|uniref:Ribosomal RNA adenine dimethylase family protein n=1 Tax=Candidatus Nitrosopumilus salarius BD31 TaxID=859350 RepID=I3D240_9ARCH|nr:rRNA adenine dimethyltransferase family protein [Candidatus Nitrosopumilus salaria]EIJ65783.1 ribosomal RNA adenine dimethylase family protein [Candidatus Nitrosopumilus salaria BD31]
MIKRKQLGQHFLNSSSIAKSIILDAKISKNDIVYEVGTGLGILTPLLCEKAQKVISIDLDENLVRDAKIKFSNLENLVLKSGDGFKNTDSFTIFVSNLPYSKSKDAIEWLSQTPFSHGVIMVQKEFADKLLAKSSKNRKAISIIATHAFEITMLSKVGKNNFSPPPKVDSVLLKIVKKNDLKKDLILTIHKIFSYRRKTIKNILKQFHIETVIDKRVDDLTGDEIIAIANQILEK